MKVDDAAQILTTGELPHCLAHHSDWGERHTHNTVDGLTNERETDLLGDDSIFIHSRISTVKRQSPLAYKNFLHYFLYIWFKRTIGI